MKVRLALADAERRLAEIPGQPRQDAELLMAHALGVGVADLKLRHLDDKTPPEFWQGVRRRIESREPIAYIVGRAGFWTIELKVGPGVLIPRADSETLIEAAREHFHGRSPATILDLGTGPGTLLLAALTEWPRAKGLGIDKHNIGYAVVNAQSLGISCVVGNPDDLGLRPRATFRLGDWAEGIDATFDLVLCNPPYIEDAATLDPDVANHEPHAALFAGADGLDAYRILAPQISRLVAPGGVACVEHGAGQGPAVAALFDGGPFTISSRKDIRGIERCLVLRR